MEKAIIKIKYKELDKMILMVFDATKKQIDALINTLHQDQVNIEYYEVFLDEINNDEEKGI